MKEGYLPLSVVPFIAPSNHTSSLDLSQKSTTCRLHGDFKASRKITPLAAAPFNFFLELRNTLTDFPVGGGGGLQHNYKGLVLDSCNIPAGMKYNLIAVRTIPQKQHFQYLDLGSAHSLGQVKKTVFLASSQAIWSMIFLLSDKSVKLCTGILTTSCTNLSPSLKGGPSVSVVFLESDSLTK